MREGHFVARTIGLSGNFTIFGFPPSNRDKSKWLPEDMVAIYLMSSEGNGITDSVAEKVTAQKCHFYAPTFHHDLRHQFNSGEGALVEICGELAKLLTSILMWVDHINKHKELYKESENKDPLFMTKVLYVVDERTDRYMWSCRRNKPNASLLEFKAFQADIKDRRFNVQLPPELKTLAL